MYQNFQSSYESLVCSQTQTQSHFKEVDPSWWLPDYNFCQNLEENYQTTVETPESTSLLELFN